MPSNNPLTWNGSPAELLIGGKRYSSLVDLEPQHYRLFFILLSFTDPQNDRRLSNFSFTAFCERSGLKQGSPQANEAEQYVNSLINGKMRVFDPETANYKLVALFE
jgi:hypothetical protein